MPNIIYPPETTVIFQGAVVMTGDTRPEYSRTQLTQENLARHRILPTEWRVWDAMGSLLPSAAANDDLGIVGGTFGSASPSLQSGDAKATTVTRYARCTVRLPHQYVAGETVLLRVHAGMLTTVSDGTATIDFQVYRSDDAAGIGSDLCATGAQSINSLTPANKDFVITAASLGPGDLLDIRMTIAITDAATGTAVIGMAGAVELLLDVKG